MKEVMIAVALVLSMTQPALSDWRAGQEAADRDDFETAATEWRRAADEGDARAQYSLGFLHQMGDGVTRDYDQATHYYKMAAEQGHSGAQVALGNLCRMGLGMAKDYVMAYMWFSIATAGGHSMGPRNVERVSAKMSDDEIAEAQRLELVWTQKYASN